MKEVFLTAITKLPEVIVKFIDIYSEKATTFCEIVTLLLSYVVPVKSKISQNFVAFSEYMNFITNIGNYSTQQYGHIEFLFKCTRSKEPF